MRYILIIILAALLSYPAVFIGDIGPGNYVKIYAGNYVAELNLLGFIVALVLTVLAVYLVIKLFVMCWKAPKSFTSWRKRSNTLKASQELGAGYLSLIKGDWKSAEKHLTTKSDASQIPYVNFLAAAQAAQEQGRMTQRDDYLNLAFKAAPKERLAIGLIKTRLHQGAGQYEQAEATLNDIADLGRKNAQYTAMLLQTYQHTGQWQKVNGLLSAARKQHALPDDLLDNIANQAHTATLKSASDIEQAWKDLPRDQRKEASNVALYAANLIDKGEMSAAEKIIRSTLKSSWSDSLVSLYATINTGSPDKLRRQAEGWLMARPESAQLNLAAGQFAMQEKNAVLAKEYLQKAIELAQLPKAYSLLGELYESENDSGKALQLYRSGMISASQWSAATLMNSQPSIALGDSSATQSGLVSTAYKTN